MFKSKRVFVGSLLTLMKSMRVAQEAYSYRLLGMPLSRKSEGDKGANTQNIARRSEILRRGYDISLSMHPDAVPHQRSWLRLTTKFCIATLLSPCQLPSTLLNITTSTPIMRIGINTVSVVSILLFYFLFSRVSKPRIRCLKIDCVVCETLTQQNCNVLTSEATTTTSDVLTTPTLGKEAWSVCDIWS